MKKIIFHIALGALLCVFSVRVEAQQPGKVSRIGFLTFGSSSVERKGVRNHLIMLAAIMSLKGSWHLFWGRVRLLSVS